MRNNYTAELTKCFIYVDIILCVDYKNQIRYFDLLAVCFNYYSVICFLPYLPFSFFRIN